MIGYAECSYWPVTQLQLDWIVKHHMLTIIMCLSICHTKSLSISHRRLGCIFTDSVGGTFEEEITSGCPKWRQSRRKPTLHSSQRLSESNLRVRMPKCFGTIREEERANTAVSRVRLPAELPISILIKRQEPFILILVNFYSMTKMLSDSSERTAWWHIFRVTGEKSCDSQQFKHEQLAVTAPRRVFSGIFTCMTNPIGSQYLTHFSFWKILYGQWVSDINTPLFELATVLFILLL